MDRRALKQAAREDIRLAKGDTKLVTQVYMILTLGLVVLSYVVSLLFLTRGSSLSAGGRNLIQYLFSLLCQFLQVLLTAGYTAFTLDLIYRREFSLGTLWNGFRRTGPVLLLHILEVAFLVLWGMLFFFLLGLVYLPLITYLDTRTMPDTSSVAAIQAHSAQFFTSPQFLVPTLALFILLCVLVCMTFYRYRMAYFLLMEYPKLTARQALKLSVTITKGHRWKLFVLDLSFVPWVLLCSLTLGILLIWKQPYMQATYARAYRFMMDDYGKRREDLKAYWDKMWVKEPAGEPEHGPEQTQEDE